MVLTCSINSSFLPCIATHVVYMTTCVFQQQTVQKLVLNGIDFKYIIVSPIYDMSTINKTKASTIQNKHTKHSWKMSLSKLKCLLSTKPNPRKHDKPHTTVKWLLDDFFSNSSQIHRIVRNRSTAKVQFSLITYYPIISKMCDYEQLCNFCLMVVYIKYIGNNFENLGRLI